MRKLNQKHSRLKTKLRRRQIVFGAWMSFYHPSIAEVFCKTGVDFLGIDLEHSTISQEQAQRIIAACQASDTLALPRIATHNMEMVKRVLDSGADGIIAPMVSTKKQAEQIASWCKYPPHGERSFGVARAQGYGLDYEKYTKSWNDACSLIVQVETAEGVDNIEDILSCEQVDAVMIGPYDISGSYGIPGQIYHRKVQLACNRVVKACSKKKKSCGIQLVDANKNQIRKAFSNGYNFLVLSSDLFIMWKWSEQTKRLVRDVKKIKQ